jgi:hypothetical protein
MIILLVSASKVARITGTAIGNQQKFKIFSEVPVAYTYNPN